MAELQSPQHPLEVLPAMLNLMLVQTGKFFKDAASENPEDLVTAKDVLTEVGNSANRRFHEALDELEIEFTRAKAVFERDLKKERAKRAERERAAGILTRPAGVIKTRSPGAGSKKSPPGTGINGGENGEVEKAIANDGPDDKAKIETNVEAKVDDQVMTNGVDASEDTKPADNEPIEKQPEAPALNGVETSLAKTPPDPSQDLAKTETSPIKINPEQAPEKLSPPPAPAPPAHESAIPDPQPNPEEAAPFESMFNDLEPASNTEGLDFDLGFSTSASDLLNDSVFENIDMSNNEESASLNATSAEDINTLLPGLENYVNDGGDFSMIDLPMGNTMGDTAATVPMSGITEQVAASGGDNGDAGVGQSSEIAPMESNFDDLFGSGDWAGDGDMGDGAMVDFDDDWFNTDG